MRWLRGPNAVPCLSFTILKVMCCDLEWLWLEVMTHSSSFVLCCKLPPA